MQCPQCDTQLQRRTIRTVEVDECFDCKGVWFDIDELRKAKDDADADLQWMDFDLWKHPERFHVTSKPLACPRCAVDMAAIEYDTTGVEVNSCPKCEGVWLDAGEFEKIIASLTEELLSKDVPAYIRASLEEAKEILSGPESFVSEWKDFLTVLRLLDYRILIENPNVRRLLVHLQQTFA